MEDSGPESWCGHAPVLHDCCRKNYALWQQYSKWAPALTKLPDEWVEDPECNSLCPKVRAILLHKTVAPRHALAAKPETEYAFTLTMPPDYTPPKPIEEAVRLIMTNGLTNKPYEKAESWAFVKEHTDKGTPHIHGVYKTPSGRRISTKYFARYWPLWDEKVKLGSGHKGGYHSPARHSESLAAYMEKEGVVIKNVTP